jgi:uncharacterized membrane protein
MNFRNWVTGCSEHTMFVTLWTSLQLVNIRIKFYNGYQSFILFSVDTQNVFACYHIYCGFKDVKKRRSIVVVFTWHVLSSCNLAVWELRNALFIAHTCLIECLY